jgi:sialidase-1
MSSIEVFTVVEANPNFPRHDSATIVELNDGRLLLAWMQHTGGDLIGNDEAPCDIASMISSDGGFTWTDHKILVENNPGDANIHFPSFVRLNTGEILFYYQRRHSIAAGEKQVSTSYTCKSRDDGQTFSTPIKHTIIENSSMSANLLVQLSTGRIILPVTEMLGAWCGVNEDGTSTDDALSGCCYSDDNGDTWKQCTTWASLPLRGAMEPHIVELSDGRLLMTLRTQLGAVFQSDSTDGGENWSKPQTTTLRAPESMPCLAKFPATGDLLMIWNHARFDPEFDHSGKRTPLTSAISKDEGRSWENYKDIETDPLYEFTNPSVHFTSQGKVIITYVTSKMDNPDPPGKLGRSCMPMKAAVADTDWFYQ